jgi:hypothetical protein
MHRAYWNASNQPQSAQDGAMPWRPKARDDRVGQIRSFRDVRLNVRFTRKRTRLADL